MEDRAAPKPDLLDLLALEKIEENLYRANAVIDEDFTLYGGQVAAQALRAAGLTVDPGRAPHSLHGYFLRAGDCKLPTVFKVYRDRDGRSFSARRVVAIQHGEVIFNMSTSFHENAGAAQEWSQAELMPDTASPFDDRGQGTRTDLSRLRSIESWAPAAQPLSDRAPWPTRFWARTAVQVPDDPLMHACALTYVSDVYTGVLRSEDGRTRPGASLDHAVWFHAQVDMNDWVLTDYHPQAAGNGRGWYTGSVYTADGTLVASMAQETLYR